MSFKEKSIWITLVATLLIFGYYFVRAYQMIGGNRAEQGEIALFFVSIIVLIIIVEIISHIILAIAHRPEATDERDRIIELKATRNAYYLLVGGVFIALAQFWLYASAVIVLHIILFSFILGVITADITKLIYYRKGI